MANAAAALVLAFLLVAGPYAASAAITCGYVASNLSPCFPYVRGTGPLTPGCCNGVRNLAGAAQTTPDRQAACGCLKRFASSGFNPGAVAGLPSKCGVSVPYPISPNVDCSTVH